MKKSILLFLLSVFFLASYAQVKKVAILGTVDKVGDVSYGVLLQVRSSLTYAISNTPGYEGYDRVDVSAIMEEHQFQRTGMVSESQIKQLGQMTGAAYVLIAEAVVYDTQHIMITAKILDVETGGVINSSKPEFASKEPTEMSEACMRICKTLFGEINTNSSYDSNYVDLGLPSGTLWCKTNEGDDNTHYTPVEGHNKFGKKLPSSEQWNELLNKCTWTWSNNSYKIVGPNGNYIHLPAKGTISSTGYLNDNLEVGSYLSSSLGKYGNFIGLHFYISEDIYLANLEKCNGVSVRLVKDLYDSEDEEKYIDLGLPSRTRWSICDEGVSNEYYIYQEAMEKFQSNLPSQEDFNELLQECVWEWNGCGYDVIGPNGNVLQFSAKGLINCSDIDILGWGEYGLFWSSVEKNPEESVCLVFIGNGFKNIFQINLQSQKKCLKLPVRLIKKY